MSRPILKTKKRHIQKRSADTAKAFAKRTIAAQTHALAALISIAGFVILYFQSRSFGIEHTVSTAIFAATATFTFLTSAVYHFASDGFECSPELELFFENLDHMAIYLFIAGTYTPFVLNVISEPWQSFMIKAVWIVAVVGIAYTFLKPKLPKWAQHRAVYTTVFVAMGWLLFLRLGEVYERLDPLPLFLLLAGGFSYSVGAVVYATKRPKLLEGFFGFHEVWHVLVVMGFLFHYAMIFQFYLPS
jgi:hemolysin III